MVSKDPLTIIVNTMSCNLSANINIPFPYAHATKSFTPSSVWKGKALAPAVPSQTGLQSPEHYNLHL